MPFSVNVSGLGPETTETQLKEFFSFCGRVADVSITAGHGEKALSSAVVTFEKPAAIKTALLLSDSELAGHKVQITADEKAIAAAEEAAGVETPEHKVKDSNGQDIGQEYKPRAAILAEYLSHGYVLGDKVISRGLALDEKHGISSRFTTFLQDLDSKYKVRDRAEATDRAYGITDNLQKQHVKLSKYFDQALATGTGSRIHSYYTELVKNVADVHGEARRLADIKHADAKAPASESTEAPAPTATTTQ